MADLDKFMECKQCAGMTELSVLCDSCLHNRAAIAGLHRKFEVLGKSIHKFAPDLSEELVKRYKEENKALDDFLELIRKE